jgi:hypothetical protein
LFLSAFAVSTIWVSEREPLRISGEGGSDLLSGERLPEHRTC